MSSISQTQGDGHTSPVPTLAPARVLTRLGPGPTVVVVGVPAPAAVRIVDRLLQTDTRTIACVVSRDQRAAVARMHRDAQATGRLRFFEGSAAEPGLGLACTAWRVLDTAEEIHCVASAEEIATRHIHEFADECPGLRRLQILPSDPATRWGALRRLGRSAGVLGLLRTASARVAASLAAAGVTLAAPFALALRPWTDLVELDLEAALSWEDLEGDLWPGLGRTA